METKTYVQVAEFNDRTNFLSVKLRRKEFMPSFAVVSQTVRYTPPGTEVTKRTKVFDAIQGFRYPLGVLECPPSIKEAAILFPSVEVQ